MVASKPTSTQTDDLFVREVGPYAIYLTPDGTFYAEVGARRVRAVRLAPIVARLEKLPRPRPVLVIHRAEPRVEKAHLVGKPRYTSIMTTTGRLPVSRDAPPLFLAPDEQTYIRLKDIVRRYVEVRNEWAAEVAALAKEHGGGVVTMPPPPKRRPRASKRMTGGAA